METTTEQIWKDHYKKLRAFTLSKVNEKDIAADILQEAFIQIHLNLHKLENKDKLESWIYTITRNLINDHFRKYKNTEKLEKIVIAEESNETNNNAQFASCMSSFIPQLPEKYREAVELSEFKGIPQTQLANTLKLSYSAVKSRVQRGKEMLKALFNDCCQVQTDSYGNIISATSKCQSCTI